MFDKALIAVALPLALAALPLHADVGTKINFKGNLFQPACELNGGKTIDIDFGKVGIKKVDGVKYAQTTTVNLNCRASEGKKLMLQIQGNTLSGRGDVVTTDTGNLGIAFQDGKGAPLFLNRFFEIQNDTAFSFIVVPIKKDLGQPLGTGQFSAIATLVSSYF